MNRRVALTVMDEQGRSSRRRWRRRCIRAIDRESPLPAQKCCDEILKRLDRLDEIAKMLRDMADQNAGLAQGTGQPEAAAGGAPEPDQRRSEAAHRSSRPPRWWTQKIARIAIRASRCSVSTSARTAMKHVTFSGRARYFAPFQGALRDSGARRVLLLPASSGKASSISAWLTVSATSRPACSRASSTSILRQYQNGGTLGQAALTLDYIFRLGRVGVFGTKGFLDNSCSISTQRGDHERPDRRIVCRCGSRNMRSCSRTCYLEKYLRVVDQVGVQRHGRTVEEQLPRRQLRLPEESRPCRPARRYTALRLPDPRQGRVHG